MIEITDIAIEDVLNDKGFIVAHPKGFSMRPFLRADDTVVLMKSDGNVNVWDCVLFNRADGVKVLHRVIKVSENAVLTRGDYELHFDAPVKKENILAVMTEFYRGGKHVDVKDEKYIRKTHRWNGRGRKFRLFFYRRYVRAIFFMKRVFNKIFKKSA